MSGFPRIRDGEWVCVTPASGRPYRMACCDCLLVHRLEFEVVGEEIHMRAWRDAEATAELRASEGRV